MITAVHTLVYADDAQAARAFFRDVLAWPCVDARVGAHGAQDLFQALETGALSGEWNPLDHVLPYKLGG